MGFAFGSEVFTPALRRKLRCMTPRTGVKTTLAWEARLPRHWVNENTAIHPPSKPPRQLLRVGAIGPCLLEVWPCPPGWDRFLPCRSLCRRQRYQLGPEDAQPVYRAGGKRRIQSSSGCAVHPRAIVAVRRCWRILPDGAIAPG